MEITDYNNNKYGTSFRAVDEVMNGGRICLMNIHFTAAQKIEKRRPNWARFIFITVSGGECALRKRLEDRGSETPQSIENRLQKAAEEFAFLETNPDFFHYILANDTDVDHSVDALSKVLGSWYPRFEARRLEHEERSRSKSNRDELEILKRFPFTLFPRNKCFMTALFINLGVASWYLLHNVTGTVYEPSMATM